MNSSSIGKAECEAAWHQRARITLCAALCVAVVALAAVAGYQRLFSTFAPYDDEGYLMISLKSFLDGKPLYDKTFTQYGPAYYFIHGAIHDATQLGISHDVTRLKTLSIWLLTSVFAGILVHRLSKSWVLGLVALLFTVFHLERFALEPGHPQELCLLFVVAALLLATYLRRHPHPLYVSLLGGITGTVAMIKPNVGAFLFCGLVLACCLALPRGRWGFRLTIAMVAATLLMPFALMHDVATQVGGLVLPALVVVATAAVLYVGRAAIVEGFVTARTLCWFVGSCAATSLFWSAAAMLNGTSWQGLLHGLVLQHAGFGQTFFTGAPISWFALPWALLVLAGAVAAARGNLTAAILLRANLIAALFLVAFQHLIETASPLRHGLVDRGQALFLIAFTTPLVWTILVPVSKQVKPDASYSIARVMLCLLATLQPLVIFPTPGTQTAVGSVLLLLVGLVAVGDLRQAYCRPRWLHAPREALVGGLAALTLAALLCRDIHLTRYRSQLQPLGLPGATALRLPADEVARHRWLSTVLRTNAETFVFRYNGQNSYYFWTRIAPPTALNATCWPVLLNTDQQQRIREALSRRLRVCVVSELQNWPDVCEKAPLFQHLGKNFRPGMRRGNVELWFRNSDPGGMAVNGN